VAGQPRRLRRPDPAYRRAYYEPLLPEIDRNFRKLDAQMRLRLEQRKSLDRRLQHMLIAPRPDYLATSQEQSAAADRADARPGSAAPGPSRSALRERLDRLQGVLIFTQQTHYHRRLTDTHTHLRELNADVEQLETQYEAFVRARQAAMHSYVGLRDADRGLRERIAARSSARHAQDRAGEVLEAVASARAARARERLEAYQNQARFAFADSYDRAARRRRRAQPGAVAMARGYHPRGCCAPALAAACAGNPDRQTLATLHSVEPDVTEVRVENSLDQAMRGYRKFLDDAPESALTPEAMRRLADLELEKEYGILGDGQIQELPAPEPSGEAKPPRPKRTAQRGGPPSRTRTSSARDGARRRSGRARARRLDSRRQAGRVRRARSRRSRSTTRSSTNYPNYPQNDQVPLPEGARVRRARPHRRGDRRDRAADRAVSRVAPLDEVQFRRAEYFFTRKSSSTRRRPTRRSRDGPEARSTTSSRSTSSAGPSTSRTCSRRRCTSTSRCSITRSRPDTTSTEERRGHRARIADTFRVISLSFSTLGGPRRSRRTSRQRPSRLRGPHLPPPRRVLSREAALPGRRRELPGVHRPEPAAQASPHFSMRVIEIYEKGDFPKLVLESKKAFAATYGLQSEYWRHFDIAKVAEVRSYLKSNLEDLARHYHAHYQSEERRAEKPANFAEAERWYRAYLARSRASPSRPASLPARGPPARERDFGRAAQRVRAHRLRLSDHEKAAAAGYAAIYAHREHEKVAIGRGAAGGPARRGGEHAALRREVPEARARRSRAGRGGRRPVRDEGVRPRAIATGTS
jgi:TolA-binding protein